MADSRSSRDFGAFPESVSAVSVCELFNTKGYGLWAFAEVLSMAVFVMPHTFMYAYGARYYGHCSAKQKAEGDDDCEYDYVEYNMWAAASQSLWYLTAFLRSAAAGRFSDRNGRRTLFIIQLILNSLPMVPLLAGRQFTPLYLLLFGFGGLMGRCTISFQAAVSDLFPPEKRTVAYSVLVGCFNMGIFVGAGVSLAFGFIKGAGDLPKVIGSLFFWLFAILYACIVLPETLKREGVNDASETHSESANATTVGDTFDPLSVVTKVASESIIQRYVFCHEFRAVWNVPGLMFWICRIEAVLSFVISGFLFTFPSYILHLLRVHNDGKAIFLSAACAVAIAIASILGIGGLLPVLRSKYGVSDIWIVKYGTVCLCATCVVAAAVAINGPQQLPLVFVGCVLVGQSFASEVALSRIITAVVPTHKQAAAFGVSSTWISVASCLGPVSFGLMLAASNQLGVSWMTPLLALTLALAAFWLTHFHLKPGCASQQQASGLK